MSIEEIKNNLYYYDSRNPENDLELLDLTEEEIAKKQKDCACDNCFYRRTQLALELLKYVK